MICFLAVTTAEAQSLDPAVIEKVAGTTRSMCLSGSQYDLEVNADGSLSLLKKLAPGAEGKIRITQNAGAGGALNYKDEGKRIEADKNIIGCISQNLPVLLTAAGARLPATPAPRACRIRTNGIERYGREFDVPRDSGWRGGGSGYSTGNWCAELIASLRSEHPDGDFSVVTQSENQKNTCAPFNCPQYLYHCTVHVKTDPVFYEKVSADCPP
jgi:hypothetical protein